jgi:putative tricarboxylic transport membrane protein
MIAGPDPGRAALLSRLALRLAAAGLAAACTCAAMAAEPWQPRRPIELVIPSAPGGGLDLVGRTLQNVIQQDKLSSKPVTVINRPGGGGTVGIAYINTHAGDGHHVSVQALPLVTNSITGLSTVGLNDVTPLAVFVTEQVVFSVAAHSPIKSGKALIEQLRKDPASVSLAVSSSPGGQSHTAAALMLKAAGLDPKKLKIVFFDSGSEAVTSLMGGHVTASATPAGVVLGPSQAGQVRMIGTLGAVRQGGLLAEVPTWKEQGVDAEFSTWRVLVGPKNMTPEQITWWDSLLKKATSGPVWAAAVKRNLWTADYRSSAQSKVFLNNEKARLGALLGELGLAK